MTPNLDRRDFLKLLAASGCASFLGLSRSWGDPGLKTGTQGPVCPWARLHHRCVNGDDDDWNVHPHGDLNLIEHITSHTTVNLDRNWNVARLDKLDEMTRYPFIFMHSELPPDLTPETRANLREYLLRGGFLFGEDCVNGKGRTGGRSRTDFFFQRMATEIPSILPEAKFEKLPFDHPVFHCYFHIYGGLPHMQGIPHGLYGATLNGRLVALLSPSDTHCAWTGFFSEAKRQTGLQMGANIYLYAMTQPTPGGF
jgi:hypothetical protein